MNIVKFEAVEQKILDIRGQKVILDSDVAELYGVETKRVNEAVKNNRDKFPEGYIIALNKKEWDELKSKFSTSIKGGKVKLPRAFTEKGLYMLATTCPVKCAAPRRGFNQGMRRFNKLAISAGRDEPREILSSERRKKGNFDKKHEC